MEIYFDWESLLQHGNGSKIHGQTTRHFALPNCRMVSACYVKLITGTNCHYHQGHKMKASLIDPIIAQKDAEIERLRTTLQWIVDNPWSHIQNMVSIAKAALEAKQDAND